MSLTSGETIIKAKLPDGNHMRLYSICIDLHRKQSMQCGTTNLIAAVLASQRFSSSGKAGAWIIEFLPLILEVSSESVSLNLCNSPSYAMPSRIEGTVYRARPHPMRPSSEPRKKFPQASGGVSGKNVPSHFASLSISSSLRGFRSSSLGTTSKPPLVWVLLFSTSPCEEDVPIRADAKSPPSPRSEVSSAGYMASDCPGEKSVGLRGMRWMWMCGTDWPAVAPSCWFKSG
jgi:hypothetical protein